MKNKYEPILKEIASGMLEIAEIKPNFSNLLIIMENNKYYVMYCRYWHLYVVYKLDGIGIDGFRNRDLAETYCKYLNYE